MLMMSLRNGDEHSRNKEWAVKLTNHRLDLKRGQPQCEPESCTVDYGGHYITPVGRDWFAERSTNVITGAGCQGFFGTVLFHSQSLSVRAKSLPSFELFQTCLVTKALSKKPFCLILIAFLCNCMDSANAQEVAIRKSEHGEEVSTSFYIGASYNCTVHVTAERLRAEPRWLPSEPNPPLSASGAISAARGLVAELRSQRVFVPKSLEHAVLIPVDEAEGIWIWVVRFSNFFDKADIVVLMGGEAVVPDLQEDTIHGYPLWAHEILPASDKLIDVERLRAFQAHIHDDKRYLGESVTLIGTFEEIPRDHPDEAAGERFHFVVDNQIRLIVSFPRGMAITPGVQVRARAQLVGYRNLLTEHSKPWSEVTLLPGIRVWNYRVLTSDDDR